MQGSDYSDKVDGMSHMGIDTLVHDQVLVPLDVGSLQESVFMIELASTQWPPGCSS